MVVLIALTGHSTMRRSSLLLLTALCLAFAPAPLPKRTRPEVIRHELSKLAGKWELVCETHREQRQPARQVLWLFVGDALFTYSDLGLFGWQISLQPGVVPKTMHLRPRSSRSDPDAVRTACYEVQGDTLRVCFEETSHLLFRRVKD